MAEKGDDADRLIRTYWAHYRRFTSEDREVRKSADSRRWAVDTVNDVVRVEGGRAAVELMKDLADGASNEAELAYLGAGPIEDFLKSGDVSAPAELTVALRSNQALLVAFRHTWLHAIPAAAAEQLAGFHRQ